MRSAWHNPPKPNPLPAGALGHWEENRRLFNRSLRALLLQGQAAGEFRFEDATVVLQAITGMATWVYSWYQPTGPLQPADVASQMAELVLRMVGAASERTANGADPTAA